MFENEPTDPSLQTAPVPHAIDPSIPEGAVARIRKQVQGNGLKPSAVELRSIQGQVYSFFGTTSVHLTPSINEAKRAGRFTDGQIIQPGQIDGAIKEFIARVAGDRGVLGLVHETVLSRSDNGFGLSGETIPLPQVQRTFLTHEACSTCRGTGGTVCHNCQGQTRITCYRCHGQGGIPCVTCTGRGQILTPQGPTPCHACQGRGLMQCTVCMGQRMITCPECQGHGKRVCEPCQGIGWNTKSWHVTLAANTSFHMRTSNLPPALVSLINRVGAARLAADHHANITPITGRDINEYKAHTDIAGDAALWFLYRAEIPFAEMDIAMGKGNIKPKLAGYKSRLVDVPDFMDALLKPGLQHLADAAQGGAGATQMILSASRYRALGDVLRGLVRNNTKRVLKTLLESYPLGLSDETAQTIVKDSSTALSRQSLWPRTVAMVGGMAFSFIALSAFYLYGGRTAVSSALAANGWPHILAWLSDVLVIMILGIIGTHAIRVMARRSLRTVLEGLGVVAGGHLPLPKPGAPGLWLWASVIGTGLTFAFISGLLN